MTATAVFITTDEEPVGVAVASPGAAPIPHDLAAELVGRDPRAVRGLHEMLMRRTSKAGQGDAVGNAVAALDIALRDLRAKQNGVPLWRELGASSNNVFAYASSLDMPLSDGGLQVYYRGMADSSGISAGKLKVGRDPERDLERLAIVRDALAEESGTAWPSLTIDANDFWTPKQAIRRIVEDRAAVRPPRRGGCAGPLSSTGRPALLARGARRW